MNKNDQEEECRVFLVPANTHMTTCAVCREDHYWLVGEVIWQSKCGRVFRRDYDMPTTTRHIITGIAGRDCEVRP